MVFPFSFALALILTGAARVLAVRVGLVDTPAPTPLKLHTQPVPLLGGAAVMTAALISALVFELFEGAALLPAVGGLLVGTMDDVRPAPVVTRLVLLTGIGLCLALALPTETEPTAAVAVIASLLLLANGVNLLDGQNGLAAGVGALATIGLAGVAGNFTSLEIAFGGALCGFLVWNFPTARIFLGNGGAYALGAGLAAFAAITAVKEGLSSVGPIALCLGVPIAEVLSTIARRQAAGVGMSGGDRFHGYDVLAGKVGRTRSTLIMWFFGAALAVAAIALRDSPEIAAGAAALVFAASTSAGYLAGKGLREGPRD